MDRLYDASAFLNILIRGSDQHVRFQGQAVLDLTRYELGNALWKKPRGDYGETVSLLRTCLDFLSQMRSLKVIGMEEDVADTLVRNELTFYDSAYVVMAKHHGLELVTDDKKMLKAARQSGIASVRSGVDLGA